MAVASNQTGPLIHGEDLLCRRAIQMPLYLQVMVNPRTERRVAIATHKPGGIAHKADCVKPRRFARRLPSGRGGLAQGDSATRQ
jgi:hypothetical protein